jgi:hypothetical protein
MIYNPGKGNLVNTNTNQTIDGLKNFTSTPTVNNRPVLLSGASSYVLNLVNSPDAQLVGHSYFGNLVMGFSPNEERRKFPMIQSGIVTKASWSQIVGTTGIPSLNSTGYFINTSSTPPQTGIISTTINSQTTTTPTHYTVDFNPPIRVASGDFIVCSLFGPTFSTQPAIVRNSVNLYFS